MPGKFQLYINLQQNNFNSNNSNKLTDKLNRKPSALLFFVFFYYYFLRIIKMYKKRQQTQHNILSETGVCVSLPLWSGKDSQWSKWESSFSTLSVKGKHKGGEFPTRVFAKLNRISILIIKNNNNMGNSWRRSGQSRKTLHPVTEELLHGRCCKPRWCHTAMVWAPFQ